MWKEFKSFISKGNVLDLAIGIIIGTAFGKIVTSLVNDIIMPLAGLLLGGIDLKSLTVTIGEAPIAYGNFIQSIVDYLIITASIFLIIKLMNRFRRKKEEEKEKAAGPSREEELLEEIRDLLKSK